MESNSKYNKYLFVIIVILLITIAGLLYYFLREKDNQSEEISSNDTEKIMQEVSKVILLPVDEEPTIAVVNDVNSLNNQPIFLNAENGDYLLIYLQAKRAILYRSSEKRVIDVGPINISQNQE